MGQDGGGLPSWLVQGKGELEGVPGPEDVRDRLLVRAGDKNRRVISNVANIRVAPLKLKNIQNNVCINLNCYFGTYLFIIFNFNQYKIQCYRSDVKGPKILFYFAWLLI